MEKELLDIEIKPNEKYSRWRLICYGILTLIIIIVIIIIIVLIKAKNNLVYYFEKIGCFEPWYDLYGEKIENIPYFKDDKIINSFKKDGKNYNETIGEINNGKDYQKNERNYYDLYIPYSTTLRKDKINKIILYIHGGAWIEGSKNYVSYFCSRYAKMGFITATLGYTLLLEKYKEYSIFRILDEITSCIENIKEQLKNKGFDIDKLEMAIGGMSAGAHIALLYGFKIKNTPIPIKFIIDIVGPISLEIDDWYKVENNNTLENIEPENIENALKDKKIVKIFGENDDVLIKIMNTFIGNKYNEKELKEMVDSKNKIKKDNEKYKTLYKIANNLFPINYINYDTVPVICEYGGNDNIVGIIGYSKMKKLFDQYNRKIELVYMRYGGHSLESINTENGMQAIRKIHFKILEFANTYFTPDDQL